MKRIASVIILIALVTGSGRLVAEPNPSGECCRPKPVGGLSELQKNTLYPLFAAKQKLESEVIVHFTVDEGGVVSQIEVAKSGGSIFDETAMRAIANTTWSPAKQNGEPVSVRYSQNFLFRIQ